MSCEEVRLAMGAHALGALDPEEALEIDNHLATCDACGAELLELEGVAAFLGKVSESDVELVASPPRQVLDRLLNARAKRYRRGRLLMAVAASVAAFAVGGTVWTVTQQESGNSAASAPETVAKSRGNAPYAAQDNAPDTAFRAEVTPSAMPTMRAKTGNGQVFRGENDAKDYYATVSAVPGDDGTRLQVSVRNIPIGTACSLAVYDEAGEREITGSWTVTRDTYRKESVFAMDTRVAMHDISRFEVVDRNGRVLVNVEGPAGK